MDHKNKKSLKYFIGTLAIIGLIAINYLHQSVAGLFPGNIPPIFVPFVSVAIIFVMFLIVWKHERETDSIKYEFLTIATHKFRTPLTAMKWIIDILKKEENTRTEWLEFTEKLDISVNRLLEVVDMLCGLARFDASMKYAFEATSFRELIDLALQKNSQKIREKNIVFSIETEQDIPLVITDKRKIQFVVDIIIENSIYYSPEKGKVYISLSKSGDSVVFTVKDQGIGIKKDELGKVFDKFWRSSSAKIRNTEGMGLGLSVAAKIVKDHQGKIWADSEGDGKGTSFSVRLPVFK